MPPQPLSKVRSNPSCDFNIYVRGEMPQLELIVQSINNAHAHIDHLWGLIFLDLTHAMPKVGYQMYQALSGAEARRAIINAAAKERLSIDDYLLFEAVAKVLNPQRKRRNEFAHHLWGRCPDIPDALLLADPAMLAEREAETKLVNEVMLEKRHILLPPNMDYSKVQVYTRAALLEAHTDAEDARSTLLDLTFGLHFQDGSAIAVEARKKLLGRPLVARALQKISPQTAPQETPPPQPK